MEGVSADFEECEKLHSRPFERTPRLISASQSNGEDDVPMLLEPDYGRPNVSSS